MVVPVVYWLEAVHWIWTFWGVDELTDGLSVTLTPAADVGAAVITMVTRALSAINRRKNPFIECIPVLGARMGSCLLPSLQKETSTHT
jgi:hypothetical protein